MELDRTLSPYEKPFWKTKFISAAGAFDLYLLFYELGMSLVAPGKMTTLITPNKYLSAPYAVAFRNLIVSRHKLREGGMESVEDVRRSMNGQRRDWDFVFDLEDVGMGAKRLTTPPPSDTL